MSLNNKSGYFLIEIMLTLALGLFIISLVFETYLASQRSMQWQAALYHIQTQAQTAMVILKREIQQAGYLGCPRLAAGFPINRSVYPLKGSDHAILVSHASYAHAMLEQGMDNKITILANSDAVFHKNDRLIISDCSKADIFSVKSVLNSKEKQKIIAWSPLKNSYGVGAEIAKWQEDQFFIEKTRRHHADGSEVYALMKKSYQQAKTEIVEDIENMQLTFSVNEQGEIKEKLAEEIKDWFQVRATAIEFTIASPPYKMHWYLYV